jgi:hypothetical protein
MIDGTVDMSRLYGEMTLDPEKVLSDGFLGEVGSLYSAANVLQFEEILENNTLNVRDFGSGLNAETLQLGHGGSRILEKLFG